LRKLMFRNVIELEIKTIKVFNLFLKITVLQKNIFENYFSSFYIFLFFFLK
jgi:hypothetical protein